MRNISRQFTVHGLLLIPLTLVIGDLLYMKVSQTVGPSISARACLNKCLLL
jgi:hypothetical protein